MKTFKIIKIKEIDRIEILEELNCFTDVPNLNDTRLCIKCYEEFRVKNYKVIEDFMTRNTHLSCANPECSGAEVHWMSNYHGAEYTPLIKEGVE